MMKIGIFEIIIAICLIIVLFIFCLIYSSRIMAYLFDLFKSISKFIEKRKRKKIIKKLKEEEKNDRN